VSVRALGIDGGGTKTHAAILDGEGRVLGGGQGGPSNYDHVGVAAARANIAQAVRAARQACGIPDEPFDAAVLGMAGVVSESDRAASRAIAADLGLAPPERLGIDHDCRVALAGGLSGRPGIVQIAGTGSSCFGMNAAGASWRAGGWGHLLADEGSGYWLGLEALRAAVRAADGRGPSTALLPRLQEALAIGDINEIMHRVYVGGMTPTAIAALAPLTLAAASEGDAVALRIIGDGARELAACVVAVARHLGLDDGACELALVGGLFEAGDLVVAPLRAALAELLPGCSALMAELPPAVGAGLLALQSLAPPTGDSAPIRP
jgi:glucosamine kinase